MLHPPKPPIVTCTYHLDIDERTAEALKKVLGMISDNELAEKGIKGETRESLRTLWEQLPFAEEDE